MVCEAPKNNVRPEGPTPFRRIPVIVSARQALLFGKGISPFTHHSHLTTIAERVALGLSANRNAQEVFEEARNAIGTPSQIRRMRILVLWTAEAHAIRGNESTLASELSVIGIGISQAVGGGFHIVLILGETN